MESAVHCRSLKLIVVVALALSGCERSGTDTAAQQVKASGPMSPRLADVFSGCDFVTKSEIVVQLRAPCMRSLDSELVLPNGSVIVTNGFGLHLIVGRGARIDGVATIRSFESGSPDKPTPSVATPGMHGASGEPGRNAGPVQIDISGTAKGLLRILNVGEDGAPGGRGGPGRPGQTGARGRNGVDGFLNCHSGGGDGDKGGAGGNGGVGGSGGRGGAGGNVAISGAGDVAGLAIEYDISSGQPGRGGPGGEGGAGGRGGEGGSGSAFCGGGRAGPPGPSGTVGETGPIGPTSPPGQFVATPAALLQRSMSVRGK